MIEIKAIEKLRAAGRNVAKGRNLENHEECNLPLVIADEIQAEVDSRFCELPVDADGVPIRVGDKLECHANGYDGAFTVFAIGRDTVIGNHDIEWVRNNPSKWFHVASFCHHVKPRTLEDVLIDAMQFGFSSKAGDNVSEKAHEFADEIRELMKEGGE